MWIRQFNPFRKQIKYPKHEIEIWFVLTQLTGLINVLLDTNETKLFNKTAIVSLRK